MRWAILLLCALAQSAPARAEQERLGVGADLGFATMYVFRGANLFQDRSPQDANMLLSVGLSWAAMGTGLKVGYWSAYQISGSNIGHNIDAGIGAEQDLYLTYERELGAGLSLSAGVYLYFYPAADSGTAGVSCPAYLEPLVGLYYKWHLTLGIMATYMAGLQDVLADYRYFYLNPSLSRSFALSDEVSVDLSLGFGIKAYTQGDGVRENSYDLLVKASLPLQPSDHFSVTPALQMSWTNLDGYGVKDELLIWFSLTLGLLI